MLQSSLLFVSLILSLLVVIKSADLSIKYSSRLAINFNLPSYIFGFFIVAFISIIPEAFISLNSAFQGVPSFGLGTLFGSNIADLTLVFAFVILISGRNLKVESKIIKNAWLYILLIAAPITFGLNGFYSRIEGALLIILGSLFFFFILKDGQFKSGPAAKKLSLWDTVLLILSMTVLLLGSSLTVNLGVKFSSGLGVDPVLIGMFVVGIGTTLPEFVFSIRAAKQKVDGLALGDILGTVIADATILVGMIALIQPFAFNPEIARVTGVMMILAIILLLYFLKSGKILSKKEALLLILFYSVFLSIEFFVSL